MFLALGLHIAVLRDELSMQERSFCLFVELLLTR
jgi:hypothetical protein